MPEAYFRRFWKLSVRPSPLLPKTTPDASQDVTGMGHPEFVTRPASNVLPSRSIENLRQN